MLTQLPKPKTIKLCGKCGRVHNANWHPERVKPTMYKDFLKQKKNGLDS